MPSRLRAVVAGVVFALLAVMPAGVMGQVAPAGNAHPQTEILRGQKLANPFGAPKHESVEPAVKQRLASQVDLAPLADLAVYNNGRIKILGTLAHETVQELTGRKDYFDLIPEGTGAAVKYKKVKYDPLFTYLDVMIDPEYYRDKALIAVNFLPLRRAFLEKVFTRETVAAGSNPEDVRETWLRLGRLTPAMVMEHFQTVGGAMATDPGAQRALGELDAAMNAYMAGAADLLMVPTDDVGAPWKHLSTLPRDSAGAKAAAQLGAAWRAGDTAGVNTAVKELAEALPKVNPGAYPTTKRSMEALYNKGNFFEWGMWLYALAMLTLLLSFGTGRGWLRVSGIALLVGAVALHLGGFALRSYLAERYSIQNQFESMTGVSLFAALVGLGLAVFKKQQIFAAAAAGVGFLVLVTATQTGIPGKDIAREAAILNTSVLLKYHVTIVLASYGLISLGFITSLFYLATFYAERMRGKRAEGSGAVAGSVGAAAVGLDGVPAGGAARVLHDLDRAQMTILQLAFWGLGIGIMLGAWWADHSWGRWWAFDPKELWALVTWLVYLVVIHIRVTGVKNRGLITAWLSVLGFIAMLWCYFGVNLLLPGLHAYA